ncbi:MAG: hypothetical protein WAO83_10175 [Fuerstiella sp.]|mgnify:CR=1 FL=1
MNSSTLKTLAAGLLACVCLSGTSSSARAQYFGDTADNTIRSSPDGYPPSRYSGQFGPAMAPQWQDQQSMDQRYRLTNTNANGYNSSLNRGLSNSRGYPGACADGQCTVRPGSSGMGADSASYRGQRNYDQNYGSAGRAPYSSRSALTTSWDSAVSAVDPVTGLQAERPARHDHANGEGHRGHCRGGECTKPACDCPDGQCDCPDVRRSGRGAQFNHQRINDQNSPVGYDDYSLSRRNSPQSQYVPTRSPFLN